VKTSFHEKTNLGIQGSKEAMKLEKQKKEKEELESGE